MPLLQGSHRSSFACGMYSTRVWRLPIPRVFHTLLGLRRQWLGAFRQALGRRVGRLEHMQ